MTLHSRLGRLQKGKKIIAMQREWQRFQKKMYFIIYSPHIAPLIINTLASNASNSIRYSSVCRQYIPIFAKLFGELRTLWINWIEIEASLIEYTISIFCPLLHKFASSTPLTECQIAGVDLFALYTTAANLFRPNDVAIDRMLSGNCYVAAFATRRQYGVCAAVVMMCRQTCRRPIIWQDDCDVAKVCTSMQCQVQFV